MRKILCMILTVLMLLPTVCFAVSATSEETPNVLKELNTLTIDGKAFNEADYPLNANNKTLSMITAVEKGFSTTSHSPDFAFYLYIYNPSGVELVENSANSVQMGVTKESESIKYSYYGLKLLSKTKDNRLAKYRVVTSIYNSVDRLYRYQDDPSCRLYNIASFRLIEKGKLVTYPVSRVFSYSGYENTGSLVCNSFELETIELKMDCTNWISPNAGSFVESSDGTKFELLKTIYNHYEINTAYFTLPRKYVDNTVYDAVEAVRAGFTRMKTTPILIAKKGKLSDETIKAIERSTLVDVFDDVKVDVDNLVSTLYRVGDSILVNFANTDIHDWCYTDSGLAFTTLTGMGFNMSGYMKNRLSYVFEVADLPVDVSEFEDGDFAKMVVSAEELEKYFYERYNDPNFKNYYLYSDSKYQEIDYTKRVYDMQTFKSVVDSDWEKWIVKVSTGLDGDSYLYSDFNTNCSMFEVVDNPSAYVSVTDPSATANELLIGVNDVDDFSKAYKNAAANDEVLVLLRFGFSDYSCIPVYKYNDMGVSWSWTDPIGYSVEKWIYKDVNTISVTFSKDGKLITVPTVSNTVDSFGNMNVYEPPLSITDRVTNDVVNNVTDFITDSSENLVRYLRIALIVIAVVVVVFIGVYIYSKVSASRSVAKIGNALSQDSHKRSKQKQKKE